MKRLIVTLLIINFNTFLFAQNQIESIKANLYDAMEILSTLIKDYQRNQPLKYRWITQESPSFFDNLIGQKMTEIWLLDKKTELYKKHKGIEEISKDMKK